MERRIPTFEERLREVVNISYRLLCEKIVGQDISIHNEASMQLHLSVIIKQIGILYEFSSSERFSIELESLEEIESTQKSSNGKARCDIKVKLYDQITRDSCTAFIELKYFKKSINEAVTDNKFFLYCDLENLERYSLKDNSVCYEILFTDNPNYTICNNYKFCIGDGYTITASKYSYTKDRSVKISNNYELHWDIYKPIKDSELNYCFLKIELNNNNY